MDTLVSQADVVVHMAAESTSPADYDNKLFFETDVRNPSRCHGHCQTSRSRRAFHPHLYFRGYGSALAEKMDEEHPLNPMSPYASASVAQIGWFYLTRLPMTSGGDYQTFNNYGPYQLSKRLCAFHHSVLLVSR